MSDPRNTPPPKGPRGRQNLRKDVLVPSSKHRVVDEFEQQRAQSLGYASPQYQPSVQPSSHTAPPRTTPAKNSASPNAARSSAKQSAKNKHYSDLNGLNGTLPVHSVDGAGPSDLAHQLALAHQLSVPRQHGITPARPEYAGPTFHAAPAASALPMPKFFSRSVPTASPQSRLQARLDTERESDESEESEEKIAAAPKRIDSPLDVFFNAQKIERARQMSSDVPQPSAKPCHEAKPSLSGKEIFMMEMDSTGDPAPEELTIAPFKERVHAAKEEQQRLAKTQALKTLLMTSQSKDVVDAGANLPAILPGAFTRPSDAPAELSAFPSLPGMRNQGDGRKSHTQVHKGIRSSTEPNNYKGHGAPTALNPPVTMRDVKSMENDLRRLLKLDS